MEPSEFERGPGRIDSYEGLPCYTPASLPPTLSYTDDLLAVYGDAQYALGRLATLAREMENPNLLMAPFIHREAAKSSQVEGTNVTISDIYQHEVGVDPVRSANERDDVREAYNYVDAVRQGVNRLDETNEAEAAGKIDVALVCDLHETLMGSVRGEDEQPGQLRDIPVYIGARDGTPENARFIPANPDLIELLLEQLFSYIRRGEYPPLVDVALTHYQFETIHPFRDGNGRMGRLLMMLQLYDAGLLPGPSLYLSAYFKRHGETYRERLLAVSKAGAWEDWVTFVLNAIAQQAIDGYECGIALSELRETYRTQFPNSPTARTLVDYCFEQPYLTGPRAVEATERSKPAVYDAIEKLEHAGIISETTGKQRNRVYEAPEILNVVRSS